MKQKLKEIVVGGRKFVLTTLAMLALVSTVRVFHARACNGSVTWLGGAVKPPWTYIVTVKLSYPPQDIILSSGGNPTRDVPVISTHDASATTDASGGGPDPRTFRFEGFQDSKGGDPINVGSVDIIPDAYPGGNVMYQWSPPGGPKDLDNLWRYSTNGGTSHAAAETHFHDNSWGGGIDFPQVGHAHTFQVVP